MKRWRLVIVALPILLAFVFFAAFRNSRPPRPDWLPKDAPEMVEQDSAASQLVLYYLPGEVHAVADDLRAKHPDWIFRTLNAGAFAINGGVNASLLDSRQFEDLHNRRFPKDGTVVQIEYPYPNVVAFFREIAPVLWQKD